MNADLSAVVDDGSRVVGECRQCGELFERMQETDHEPLYCSQGCSRRAKRDRRRARFEDAVRKRRAVRKQHKWGACCLATTKIIHPTSELAWMWVREFTADVPDMNAYPCGWCDGWHVGNSARNRAKHAKMLKEIVAAERRLIERGVLAKVVVDCPQCGLLVARIVGTGEGSEPRYCSRDCAALAAEARRRRRVDGSMS